MARRVLIVGCGDLGQRVARRLLERGDVSAVYGLRRHPPAAEPSAGAFKAEPSCGALQWLAGDMSDPATLSALPPGISLVLFSAAPDSRDEVAYRAVFLDGPRNVLGALPNEALARLVFVSSSAVYGEHHGHWVDESTPEAPLGSNGRILLQAERQLAAQSVSTTALRLAGLYGPGRLQLIGRLKEACAPAPTDPAHWSNRIHIDDAAQACVLLLMASTVAPTYIGVDDTPLPMHVLYAYLADLIGASAPAPGRAPLAVGSKRLSNRRLRDLGFTPQWPDARAGYAALLRGHSPTL